MKDKRRWWRSLFLLVLTGLLVYGTTVKDFDAKGYVQATLDANLKGDIKRACDMIADQSEEELLSQYEEGVGNFLANNILTGVTVDEEQREEYLTICRQIYQSMEYEVGIARKKNAKEFQVEVAYHKTDVMLRFVQYVEEASEQFLKEVEKTTYKGTEEEIRRQMETAFLKRSLDCLQRACKDATEGVEETMIFTVSADEKGLFSLKEGQMSQFIEKILCIDQIQD